MIRLFTANETNFNHCKWVLNKCISCYVTETTDGIFDLDLVYPLEDDKNLSQYLIRGNIIKSPISQTDLRGEQLFTIRKRSPDTKEKTVTIYAQAKARRDLDVNMVLGLNVPAGSTRKQACQMLLNKCVEQQGYYIGNLDTNPNTNINLGLEEDTGNIINYLDINGISPRKAFLAEDVNSIYKAYGGEIIYNNFEINMVDERGINHSFEIRSGKNLEELQQEIDDTDTENFATAILPCSADGVYLPNSEIIYSPNVAILGNIFKKVVYDDVTLVNDTPEALQVVYAQLRERVQKDFNNGLDKLKINNTVNFIQLANTEEYKDYKILEKCEIGNNVTVKYFKRNDKSKVPYIEAVGRVIKIKFNVLKNKIEDVEIGERKTNILNTINNTQNQVAITDDKTEKNKVEIKKVKKYATDSVNNLQVTMEARDNEIELSISNEAEARVTAVNLLDGKIALKVDEADFGTLIEQNSRSVVIAVHGESDNKITVDSDGLTVTDGGLTYENTNGDTIIEATPYGIRIGDTSWSTAETKNQIYLGNSRLEDMLTLSKIAIDSDLDMELTWDSGTNGNITNVKYFDARYGEFYEDLYVDDTLYCESLEVVGGTKNCAIVTENFGTRLINAYETADNYFGDIGGGTIINGECVILVDVIFSECINTNIEYQVEIFEYKNRGSITDVERYPNYFIVKGNVNEVEFGWELKAKRKYYENNRLEFSKKEGI